MSIDFRFCPQCANQLQPFLDGERLRSHCTVCGWIHYLNPTVGVAVVLFENGRLLLGERQDGGWCIPCGHVEWDESVEEAAIREFIEETGLNVSLESILAVDSNFHDQQHHTVGIWYLGKRVGGSPRAGGDLRRVGFFSLNNIPTLKFPTDRKVVKQLLSRK
jgi:ADP-ribose pyrophosphatase YjhB (NUDIX family)